MAPRDALLLALANAVLTIGSQRRLLPVEATDELAMPQAAVRHVIAQEESNGR